jgi:hypothetical protein
VDVIGHAPCLARRRADPRRRCLGEIAENYSTISSRLQWVSAGFLARQGVRGVQSRTTASCAFLKKWTQYVVTSKKKGAKMGDTKHPCRTALPAALFTENLLYGREWNEK